MKITIELSGKTARFIGWGMFALGAIFLVLSLIASATINNIVPIILLITFAAIFLIGGVILIAISTSKDGS